MNTAAYEPNDVHLASAVRSAVARFRASRPSAPASVEYLAAQLGPEDQDLLVDLARAVLAECASSAPLPASEVTGQFVDSAIDHNGSQTVDNVDTSQAGAQDFHVTTPATGPTNPPGYEILGKLGVGGMGIVYKAKHLGLKRLVALKMVLAGGHATPEQLARFVAEAQAVAKLDHPNIVRVYDIGEHHGLPYFAMEYVDGGALNQRVQKEPLDPKAAARFAEAVARGVHYAHTRKVIHRDLKPANVLLTGADTPKVTDFGLAKQLDEIGASGSTQTGLIMGTPSYMAPEQAEGRTKDIDERADVYSIGATLYELLTGRPPFQAPNPGAILALVRTAEPVAPTRLQPGVPKDLETICLKCLQKEPQRRYQTAEELADDLKRFLNGEPILARPVSSAERFVRWCRRKPALAGLMIVSAALSLLFVVSLAIYAVQLSNKNETINAQNGELTVKNETINAKNTELLNTNAALEREQVAVRQQSELSAEEVRYMLLTVCAEYDEQGLQQPRKHILNHVTNYIGRLAKVSKETTGIADRGVISTLIQNGEICLRVAENDKEKEAAMRKEADVHLTNAIKVAREVVAREPRSDLAKANLALALNMAGFAKVAAKVPKAADPLLAEARALRQVIVASPTSTKGTRDAILPADARQSLASTIYLQHVSLTQQNQSDEAAEHLLKSTELRREALQMAEADPANTEEHGGANLFRLRLAMNLMKVVDMTIAQKQLPKARELAKESVALARKVVEENPENIEFPREFVNSLQSLAYTELQLGNYEASALGFEEAVKQSEAVLHRAGPSPKRKSELSLGHYGAGVARELFRDAPAAAKHYQRCIEIRRELAADKNSKLHAMYQRQLMVALARAGDAKGALEVVEAEEQAVKANGNDLSRRVWFHFTGACVYSILAEKSEASRQEMIDAAWKHAEAVVATKAVNFIRKLETDFDVRFMRGQLGFAKRIADLKMKNGVK